MEDVSVVIVASEKVSGDRAWPVSSIETERLLDFLRYASHHAHHARVGSEAELSSSLAPNRGDVDQGIAQYDVWN